MRMRFIKPGIMSNDALCELGPFAYILFTGLWMLADREGRLEFRPKRIKALAMPMWDEVGSEDIKNLVEGLWKSGFIEVYRVGAVEIIQVTNWAKHQRTHPREAASTLPPPPALNSTDSTTSDEAQPRQCLSTTKDMPSRVGNGEWVMGNGGISDTAAAVGVRGSGGKRGKSSPPLFKTENGKPKPPKPPAAANTETQRREQPPAPRKPPIRAEQPRGRNGTVDWWPYAPDDVGAIRGLLQQLAPEFHLPPPDDGLIRQVLDSARGAPVAQLHEVIVHLWKQNKFRSIYSWGFVPTVVYEWFKAA
jgi:hypothetical protein